MVQAKDVSASIGASSHDLLEKTHTTTSHSDDATEQIAILLKSLKILAQLAAMNPAEYQASLQMKMVRHDDNDNNDDGDRDDSNNNTGNEQCSVIQLQTSLEDLQKGWRLEDTPVIQLCTLIHSLHSTVNSLQKDAEEHATLYANLQKELVDSHQRNAKLERTLLRVHSKNQSLSHKMKQRSCEKRSLVKHVHACVQQIHESKEEQKQLEEQNVAFQLHAHHQFLQQQQQYAVNSPMRPGRGRSFSHDVLRAYPTTFQAVIKTRGMSQDTNFSDMDALDFATANAADSVDTIMIRENNIVLDDEIGLGDVVDHDGYISHNSADDLSCCPSMASSTLVTDDGVATPLRLSKDINTTNQNNSIAVRHGDDDLSPPGTPRRESASARKRTNSRDLDFGFGTSFLGGAWSSSKSKEPIVIHDLTFPNASVVGLQFEKLPCDSLLPKKKVPKPKGLLTEAMLSNSSSHDSPTASLPGANSNSSEEKDDRQKSGFQLKWKVFSSKSSGSQEEDTKQNGTFAITGFDGFVDEFNERPSIGEKLVAINGMLVDGTWSVGELQRQIELACGRVQTDTTHATNQEEKKCSEHDDTCLTLRFRREPLTRKERGILERAKHEQEYYEDEWGLPCKKPAKDLANSGKQAPSSSSVSSSKLSFMDSMSPKRMQTSKKKILSKTSTQEGVATGEEEIQLSSSSLSSAAATKTIIETSSKEKEELQKAVMSTASEEKIENAGIKDSAKPSSATSIFSFFSPQKVENTNEVVSGLNAKEPDTIAPKKTGESSTPVPSSSHEEQDSSVTAEKSPSKSAAGDAPANNCQTPSTAIKEKEDMSTGEKIFGSVKSLGEFFANPYP